MYDTMPCTILPKVCKTRKDYTVESAHTTKQIALDVTIEDKRQENMFTMIDGYEAFF